MTQHQYFAAIILAAGTSSRMGKAKQLLKLNGTSLLDHAIRAALDAGISLPIVVLGANAKQIQSGSTLLKLCTAVINDRYQAGLSTSLKRGLQAAPHNADAYIFMLADQPLVDGGIVSDMMKEFEKRRADILYPEYQGQRGNPVIITSTLHNRLLLAEGDRGAKFLFTDESLNIFSYPVASSAVITDIDTPEDYQRITKHSLT